MKFLGAKNGDSDASNTVPRKPYAYRNIQRSSVEASELGRSRVKQYTKCRATASPASVSSTNARPRGPPRTAKK